MKLNLREIVMDQIPLPDTPLTAPDGNRETRPPEECIVLPDVDRFYRILAREAPDAIVYADTDGRIAFWNKGAERIFGFSEAEAIGKSLDVILPEDFREHYWNRYAKTVRTGKTRYGAGEVLAVPALRKDGTRISVELTLLPFVDRAGRILGMAATLRDVTKQFEEMTALRKELAAESGHCVAAWRGVLPR
jgi:PAS domain S-box-containing protein